MHELIESIHRSPGRLVITAAGGGTGAIAALARAPGASRTLLHGVIPYSKASMTDFLGREPESICSSEAAADIARRAREFGEVRFPELTLNLIGVGVTAALATDRPRTGPNRCFVAVAGSNMNINRELILRKDARSRGDEEDLVDGLVLNCIAEAFALNVRISLDLLSDERVEDSVLGLPYWYERLRDGSVAAFRRDENGFLSDTPTAAGAILPGSFDPLHEAHVELARVASEILSTDAAYELSLANVDKPLISLDELELRLAQFSAVGEVTVTAAPTFVEKSRIFPGRVFAAGADTVPRIVDPKYYRGGEPAMLAALEELSIAGCRFLVAGRVAATGDFVGLADLKLPAEYGHLFEAIPEGQFRFDVSSTDIRDRPRNAAC